MGYYRAGFDVVGVDLNAQPNYPFEFWEADAMTLPKHVATSFDAIHASPPCQAYSGARTMWNAREGHPDLVEPTRQLLKSTELPWVMENVEGAPMSRSDDLFGTHAVTLCGTQFKLGYAFYELRRHRLFEASFPIPQPQCRHGWREKVIGFYGDHARTNGARSGGDLSAGEGMEMADKVMGINWCTWKGVSQAIPPAYTEFIGKQLIQHLSISVPTGGAEEEDAEDG